MMFTTEHCMSLLKKYNVYDNIVLHCVQVNKVAVFISKKLVESGVDVDVKLVNAASLLHDIAKHIEIETGKDHIHEAEIILKKENAPQNLIDVVKAHLNQNIDQFKTLEEKIVFYADMRVKHSKIVSLDERINDIRIRYSNRLHLINSISNTAKIVEKEIFSKLDIKPDDINNL